MTNEPIWVAHPNFENRSVNVGPLLRGFSDFDAPQGSSIAAGAQLAIARVIKTLNLTVHDPQITPPGELANLYRDLHMLEEALGSLAEKEV